MGVFSARAEFIAGVRDGLPIVVGVAPCGMIYGALAVGAGMPPAVAQAASGIIFAGSAQFLTAQLVGIGAPAAVIIASAIIVNLRHLLYSASMAPYLRPLRPAWRWGTGLRAAAALHRAGHPGDPRSGGGRGGCGGRHSRRRCRGDAVQTRSPAGRVCRDRRGSGRVAICCLADLFHPRSLLTLS